MTTKASRSIRGWPAVPRQVIFRVCRPEDAQAATITSRRLWPDVAWRSTELTALPSRVIEATPRVLPRGATQATRRPVKVNVADAPRAVADRSVPPEAAVDDARVQRPDQVIARDVSCTSVVVRTGPVTHADVLPRASVARTRNRWRAPAAGSESETDVAAPETGTVAQVVPPFTECSSAYPATPEPDAPSEPVHDTATRSVAPEPEADAVPSQLPATGTATGAPTTGGVTSGAAGVAGPAALAAVEPLKFRALTTTVYGVPFDNSVRSQVSAATVQIAPPVAPPVDAVAVAV